MHDDFIAIARKVWDAGAYIVPEVTQRRNIVIAFDKDVYYFAISVDDAIVVEVFWDARITNEI